MSPGPKHRAITHYPGWRLLSFAPFFDGTKYVSGITVYVSYGGIFGVTIDGLAREIRVGRQYGYAIHLPLNNNEFIYSAWIRTSQSPGSQIKCLEGTLLLVSALYLLFFGLRINTLILFKLTTNLGRSQHFGTWKSLQIEPSDDYRWTDLGNKPNPFIAGLCFDELADSGSGPYPWLGATCAISENPRYGNVDVSASFYRTHSIEQPVRNFASSLVLSQGLCFSVASLKDARNLCVCRVGDRCTGLRIIHENSKIEILGQWYPKNVSSTSRIYDSTDGPLATVIFCYSGTGKPSGEDQYVRRIIAEMCPSSPIPIESFDYYADVDTVRYILRIFVY